MKFLLLMGLLPVFVSFIARKFLSDGPLRKEGGGEVSLTGREVADRILKKGKVAEVVVEVKSRPFLALGPSRLILSPALAESKRARDVASAALLAGMVLMARQQEKVMGWRKWAVKFGTAMPAFTAIVMAFAMVMGRLSTGWSLGIVSIILGLSTAFLWFTLPVEKASAGVVAEMLEESAVVPRRSEGELLASLVRAAAWSRIVPGAVAWIVGK